MLQCASCQRQGSHMSEQGPSPEELAKLLRRLDFLIDEARTLQEQITARLRAERRRDQPDRSGQPERRRGTRSKNLD
jgi:hypothetical protein